MSVLATSSLGGMFETALDCGVLGDQDVIVLYTFTRGTRDEPTTVEVRRVMLFGVVDISNYLSRDSLDELTTECFDHAGELRVH